MSRSPNTYDRADDPRAVPRNDALVQHALDTISDTDDLLDAISKARGWPSINLDLRNILEAYLNGTTSLTETADTLCAPIEKAYSSADQGYAFWEAESTARALRPLCSPSEIDHYWGPPVATCEPDPARAAPQNHLEGRLWGLYVAIIHVSRRLDWSSESSRLSTVVRLLQTLQQRRSPPEPDNATLALRTNRVCKPGRLWADLSMLGASVAESYNSEHPGGMMGFTEPEVRAWENANAFLARLTAEGICDFMAYGVWAMWEVLEGGIANSKQATLTEEAKRSRIDVGLRIVVVWVCVAGQEMYARVLRRERNETRGVGAVVKDSTETKWTDELFLARWRSWKDRLAELVRYDHNEHEGMKNNAARASQQMVRVEASYKEATRSSDQNEME